LGRVLRGGPKADSILLPFPPSGAFPPLSCSLTIDAREHGRCSGFPRRENDAPCGGMTGTDPQLLLSSLAFALAVLALIASAFTWAVSRAKKVRLVEDQVISELRAHRSRADQVETKLGEWQVTITAILAEVEEFFDRTVKERKRIQQQNARADQVANGAEPDATAVDMSTLSRAQQLDVVDRIFASRGH